MSKNGYLDPRDFDSRVEYTEAMSNWHFDYSRKSKPQEDFQILGRFMGDWEEEVEYLKSIAVEKSIKDNDYRHGPGPFYRLNMMESYDYEKHGVSRSYTPNHEVENYNPDETPLLKKMIEAIGVDPDQSFINIFIQKPGNYLINHIDCFTDLIRDDLSPDTGRRYSIALTPWEPGHIWYLGNSHWMQWEPGEIMTWDWKDIPHATANLSYRDRIGLRITGRMTDKSREFMKDGLDNPSRKIILKV